MLLLLFRDVASSKESKHRLYVLLKISEFIEQVDKVIEAALEKTPSRGRVLNTIVYLGYLVEHLTLIEGEDISVAEDLCTDVADILVIMRGVWLLRQGGWEKGIEEMQTWEEEKIHGIFVEHGWAEMTRQLRLGKRKRPVSNRTSSESSSESNIESLS